MPTVIVSSKPESSDDIEDCHRFVVTPTGINMFNIKTEVVEIDVDGTRHVLPPPRS